MLMWPDLAEIKKTNPIWGRLNLEPVDRIGLDSGILLADKARVWDVLDLAVLMNEHCDEIYDALYGDKDTFLLSAQLLDRAFGLVPHRPFVFEWDFVQRDPAGEPFLHHRTTSKWLLHHANRPVADASLTPHCDAALADLRSRWSGRVFHAPERSPRARTEEARLIGLRYFRFEPSAGGPFDIELLPGGRIGAEVDLVRHWTVIERAGALVLEFYAEGAAAETFDQLSDGSWRGVSCAPGFEVRLKERSGGVAAMTESDRVFRSAEYVVAALSDPSLFAAGYDADRAAGLSSALSLLNEMFDDVPEQVVSHQITRGVSSEWRRFLDQLVSRLTDARDRRIALVHRDKSIGPRAINPAHYARPL
jgi:hypothetical protein